MQYGKLYLWKLHLLKKGNRKIELIHYYYQKDFFRLNECLDKMQEYVLGNESVPADLVKEFFGYFEAPMIAEKAEREEKLSQVKAATLNYFRDKKDYWFRVSRRELTPKGFPIKLTADRKEIYAPQKQHTVVYSLERFIERLFNFLAKYPERFAATNTKPQLAEYILAEFEDYIKTLPKSPLSYRATRVVIGFIVAQFGFLATPDGQANLPKSYRGYNEYLSDNLKRLGKHKKK